MTTTAATAQQNELPSEDATPLPLRGDNLLGVCEAVGQELGFNPNWLRIPFAALLFWNPAVVVGSYLGLGVIVGLTRLLLPVSRKPSVKAEPVAETVASETAVETQQREEELLAA